MAFYPLEEAEAITSDIFLIDLIRSQKNKSKGHDDPLIM